jgi:hypothetical protein
LVQLLGSDRHEQLREFVDDVERVRLGDTLSTAVESLTLEASPPTTTTTTATKTVEETLISKLTTLPTKKAPPVTNATNKTTANGKQHPQKQSHKSYAGKVVPTKTSIVKENLQQHQMSKQNQKSNVKQQMHPTMKQVPEEVLQQPPEDDLPLQGDAKVVCGCFGTMHKALNNCLHCGRISCEREGYDYCPFCRYMVHEHRSTGTFHSADDGTAIVTWNSDAWEQKERLLRYDREFAQRTIILDDQADYYNRSTSNWLSEQEQREAQQQEQQRSDALQKRALPKMVLDIE